MKKGGKRFEDAAGQFPVMIFGKNIFEVGITKHDAQLQPRNGREVGDQFVILVKV